MDIRVLQYFLAVAREESITKAAETEAVSTIAKVAKDLQKEYPLIRCHIYSGDAEHIIERLDKGLIDFGLFVFRLAFACLGN